MHESNHLAHRQELVLLDLSNPRSIACLMPEAFAKQMQILWDSDEAPALLGVNEHQLLALLRRKKKSPSALDYKLRVKFWVEYERVQTDIPKMAKMNMQNILGLDFAKESFYRFYITDPYKLAFLLCPPMDYEKLIDVVLNVSTQKLLEILDSPEVFSNGVIDQSLVKKFMEINETMHRRKLQLEFRGGGSGGRRAKVDDDPDDDNSEPLPPVPVTEEEKLELLKKLREENSKLPGQG